MFLLVSQAAGDMREKDLHLRERLSLIFCDVVIASVRRLKHGRDGVKAPTQQRFVGESPSNSTSGKREFRVHC